MPRKQTHRRFRSLITLALFRELAPTRHPFPVAAASAFSPSLRSSPSSSFCSARFCPPMTTSSLTSATVIALSDEAKRKNAMPLSYLETPSDGGGKERPDGSPPAPPVLLVHGLDSSSHTWRGVLDDLGATGLDAVAVDQRGCGTSPLGDPDRFSPDALADDLYDLISSHPHFLLGAATASASVAPFVLVGHSMGGRVAMSFAARHPECVAALVVEDMDVRRRSLSESRVRSRDRDATLTFDRDLPGVSAPEGVIAAFEREGYPRSQVEKWLSEGRVEPVVAAAGDDGSSSFRYRSQVNPAFRLLCYEQFFESNHGEETWNDLAAAAKENGRNRFPIHLMIADPSMTICDDESVTLMKDAMEGTIKTATDALPLLTIHRYPNATHSIHNSAREEFVRDLKAIVEDARTQQRA